LAGTNLASLSELIAAVVVLILGSCTAGDLVHRKGKLALQNDASGLTLTSDAPNAQTAQKVVDKQPDKQEVSIEHIPHVNVYGIEC